MKKTIALLFFSVTLWAQNKTEKDSIKHKKLADMVITTTKFNKKRKDIPQQTTSVSKQEIEFQNFQNTADVLSNTGIAHVQKSQQGGGSPVIRGFEASRILLLVDNIRMNNLIFRTGHLQNVITVDENMLKNVDVFYGPSSTVFGSDALGGSINLETKKAEFFSSATKKFSGNVTTRYGSVNEEKSVYFDLNYAANKWASLTAFSFNDFGDLKMGKKRNHNGDSFGERHQYVITENGTDILVPNKDKYLQKFTAYQQYNFMQKVRYKQDNGALHGLNLQFSTTNDIPRYDRLTDPNGAGLRNSEWFYGPQKRILTAYTYNKDKAFLGSDLKLTASYQNVKESRHNRRFNNYDLQNRIEKVSIYSITADLKKKFKSSELLYGIEFYYDNLKSSAYKNNINTGETANIDTRYPNGDNNMFRSDVYLSFSDRFSENTKWNAGARAGYVSLKSAIADNTFFELPFTSIAQSNFTYSGSLGIIHNAGKNVSFIANAGTGFRAPNIDDLAKIFESGNGNVIVPNKNLKPEKTITTDLGFNITSNNRRFSLENTYYYTRFIDAIITDKFTFNGQSTIDYNGSSAEVYANQNKGKAFVTGISTNVKTYLVGNLQLNAVFNYTLGRIVSENGYLPLDHIPPYFGKVGLNYFAPKYGVEAYMLYNGKKALDEYFPNGEDNEQYAPQGGMPAWETYNIKGSVTVFKRVTMFAGVENILDTQYRTFASGMNAGGRNMYSGFKYSF